MSAWVRWRGFVLATEKKVIGYIDCPACGTVGGMRVTHDKNGEPFGFCEAECSAQLRIGGNPRRLAAFLKKHPWAAGGAPEAKPAPVPEPEPKPAQKPEPKPEPKPAPKPTPGTVRAPFGLDQL